MERMTNDMKDFGASVEAMEAALARFSHDPAMLRKGVMANLRVLIHEGRTDEALRTLNRLQYYVLGNT